MSNASNFENFLRALEKQYNQPPEILLEWAMVKEVKHWYESEGSNDNRTEKEILKTV